MHLTVMRKSSMCYLTVVALSAVNRCALQYITLHLMGFKLSMEDLKQFRQIGSLTPGHPEAGHTDGTRSLLHFDLLGSLNVCSTFRY